MSSLLVGGLALPRLQVRPVSAQGLAFTEGAYVGRICVGDLGSWTEMKSEPDINAPTVAVVYRDDIFELRREVIASRLDFNRYNQKWFETPNGYLYSWMVQPVHVKLNQPLPSLPVYADGQKGVWVEITVPICDLELVGSKSSASYWLREVAVPKLYATQIFWASDMRVQDGRSQYLLSEKYGALPDYFWVDASACRPIMPDEVTQLSPGVGDKRIVVNLAQQKLYAFEGRREVYFCEVSTGYLDEGKWGTPPGVHLVWRKMVSLHMSAGGVSQYDSPGIGWTTLFHSEGAAIHSAYWHNNFGVALSHGCVNCRPDDAKWIYRWTDPVVDYYPGELTVRGGANSARIEVVEF